MLLFALSLMSVAIFIDWLLFGIRLLRQSHSPLWNETNEYFDPSCPIKVDCYSKRCFHHLKMIFTRGNLADREASPQF